jgi:hypothetical protein
VTDPDPDPDPDPDLVLPGMELFDPWLARVGASPHSGRRWEKQGLVVVRRINRKKFLDRIATAAGLRGELPKPKRGRPSKQPRR